MEAHRNLHHILRRQPWDNERHSQPRHVAKGDKKMDDILSEARTILLSTPARWSNLTATLPVGLLARRPAPEQWSALECLQHIVDTERVLHSRVQAFLAGQDFPAFNPDSEGTKPAAQPAPADLAAEFARRRAGSLAALALVTPDDLGRRVRHQELGPVTLGEMLHEWAAHDLNHTVQAERALMQPFIDGSGPWRPSFADHILAS
jgi:hypothetical protein